MIFNDIAFVSVKSYDYRIRFWYMSKDDEINIMKNWVTILIIKKTKKQYWIEQNNFIKITKKN